MQKLLLLHGAIGSKDQLKPLADILKLNYEVHTLNFAGHGGEQMPNQFSIELFANNVLTYMEQNNISKINIFGYSMGGYVALYLAKYYPNKIEKVFTLATKFLWNAEISQKEIKMLDASKIEEKIPAFAQLLEKRHQPNDWKVLLKKTSDMMISLGNKNSLTLLDLTDISATTKIALGDNDNMVTLDETKEVAQNLKNSELLILQDTLHPIEKVEIVNLSDELKTFFK